jgi:hypothetical protein
MLVKKFSYLVNRLKTDDLNYFEEQFLYGHREILLYFLLKNNINISSKAFLEGGLEHGWTPDDEFWRVRRRNLTRAPRYVWQRQQTLIDNPGNYQELIGAPWLYLLKSIGVEKGSRVELPIKNNRINLIVPFHSEGLCLKDIGTQALHYSKIVDPRESTICLFWLDFCDPTIRKTYNDLGFQIDCVGYNYRHHNSYKIGSQRTFFLLRLLKMIAHHRNYLSDDYSTSLWYAASLGKTVLVSQDEIAKNFTKQLMDNNPQAKYDFSNSRKAWVESNHPETLSLPTSGKAINELAWKALGGNYLLKPDQLYNLNWQMSEMIPDHMQDFSSEVEEISAQIKILGI